jgi:phosphoribosylglycinamide formyltransferase-1
LGSTRGTDIDLLVEYVNNLNSSLYNKVEFVCVLSNKKNSGILEKCKGYGIFTQHIPVSKSETRDMYDEKLTKVFTSKNVEMILCIGWMRLLSANFTKRWEKCCYNVHPSLLPEFAGGMDKDVHKKVIDSSCKETGCTVHEVTENVDSGPIIVQKKCPVYETDDVDTLKNRVQELEVHALIETIDKFASNLIGPFSSIKNDKYKKKIGIVTKKDKIIN